MKRGTLRVLTTLAVASAVCLGVGTAHGAQKANRVAAAKKPTIAFIQIGISQNPFWADQARGASEAGRRLGVNVLNLSGNLKISDQIARINDMINRHVDAIAVIPIDAKAVVPALQRAQKAGIPVLELYSTSPHAAMYSGFDEYHSGHIVGVYSAAYLQKKFGTPKGQIAVLKGQLGQTLDTSRTNGFTDVFKKYSGVQVVSEEPTEWQADKATSIMQDWLVKYPNLTMVYGLSDTITVPALDVAQRSATGRNIIFSSIDGDPIGIQAIQQGKMIATALYGPIYAGYRFLGMAYNLMQRYHKGNKALRTTLLHSALVTQSNVAAASLASTRMTKQIHTFNFNRTLQDILTRCQHANTCGK